MRVLAAVIALSLVTTPALAVHPLVEAAIRVFQAVGTETVKLKTFCEFIKLDEKQGDKDDPVIEAQKDKLLDQLGVFFEIAWVLVERLEENSPDGKALNAALDELEDKCPK
jgi:hypothetical protein